MKTVYVVRWLSRIDGEEECGNFEVCYAKEADARKAMLKDMADTKAEFDAREYDGEVKTQTLGPDRKNDPETCDYCRVWTEVDTYDYHEWWIDALDLA